MGMDFLDLTFRLERSFGIKIARSDWDLLQKCSQTDVTPGELHDWIIKLCQTRGIRVPPSSWHRVQIAVAKVVSKSPKLVRQNTHLVRELGFS